MKCREGFKLRTDTEIMFAIHRSHPTYILQKRIENIIYVHFKIDYFRILPNHTQTRKTCTISSNNSFNIFASAWSGLLLLGHQE